MNKTKKLKLFLKKETKKKGIYELVETEVNATFLSITKEGHVAYSFSHPYLGCTTRGVISKDVWQY